MPQSQRWEFYDRVEQGEPEPDITLRAIAELFRKLLGDARADVQKLGTGKLQSFIENYLPHIYKDPSKAEQIFASYYGKRPFEGSKAFLKQRKYETLKDGMESGLEPITDNPVDMVLLKLREMQKYVMAHRVLNDMKSAGTAVYVPSEQKAPPGFTQIDDKVATVFGPPAVQFKEAYDADLVQRLEDLAASLGIKHERKPNIGGQALGYTSEGSNKVVTRSATPESVLMHEIGHQLQFKFDIWKRLRDRDYPERNQELKDLADLRFEGSKDVPDSFKSYVRSKDEKMANAVAALIYAPEKFKETAPNTWDFLRDELWHIPELRPLFDIKRTMTLASRKVELPVAGLRIMGRYWAPEAAARVVNNYLSPGLREKSALFRGYLTAANAINQFNLGFSAFHLGFTTMDAAVSKFALGVYQAAHGHPLKGLVSALQTPLAPFSGIIQGDKMLREYYKPGSQGQNLETLVNAMILAGGRAKMDSFYQTGAIKKMQDAFRSAIQPGKSALSRVGNLVKGGLTSPLAAAELSVKPILEWIVPRQKMAVFADLARFELDRVNSGELNPDDLQDRLAKAWDSVDNRMGQLVYDNLFWNKAVKDLMMASVRSVGWNTGTVREILGGAGDLRKLLPSRERESGPLEMTEEPKGSGNYKWRWKPDVSTRLSYIFALPVVVGLAGAILHYLRRGEAPEDLADYFMPRDEEGKRFWLPSYAKDVISVGTEGPMKVAKGKIHPALTTIYDMLSNRDYFGHPIASSSDSAAEQMEEYGNFLLQQASPMSFKSNSGPDRTAEEQWLRAIGITPVPSGVLEPDKKHVTIDDPMAPSPYGDNPPVYHPRSTGHKPPRVRF
jgi:hypothetical protein